MEKYIQRVSEIFRSIDSLYEMAQKHYGFSCEGCADNCCVTKFHHHTVTEELLLAEGLKKLDQGAKDALLSRAEEVVRAHASSDEDVRVMCPLNESGLCMVYEQRPMICRIHGVPYQLFKKDMTIEFGTGCYRFVTEKLNENMQYFMFNRTMFYMEMAKLEKEVRETLGFSGDYSKTTAEMTVNILRGRSFPTS